MMPDDIVGEFKSQMHTILSGWERNKFYMDWGTYKAKIKISPAATAKMGEIMLKCRNNGFYGPYIDGNSINWHQMEKPREFTKDKP